MLIYGLITTLFVLTSFSIMFGFLLLNHNFKLWSDLTELQETQVKTHTSIMKWLDQFVEMTKKGVEVDRVTYLGLQESLKEIVILNEKVNQLADHCKVKDFDKKELKSTLH